MNKPQANKTIEEILEKTYRYFNGVSVWNLEDRIPTALLADKAAITQAMLDIPELQDEAQQWDEDCSMCNGCDFQLTDDTKNCLCIVRNQLRATIRTAIKKIGGSDESK